MSPSIMAWVDGFLRSPPAIVTALITAVLVSHFLRLILENIGPLSARGGDTLIAVLEIAMTLVGLGLVVKGFVAGSLAPDSHAAWQDSPFVLFMAVVIFVLLSIVLYTQYKKIK